MNSNFSNFDFDLGIGSNGRSSKSLNDQRNKSTNNSYSYSSSTSSFSQPKTTPSWQPGKPSWTHQPAPSQPGLTRTELGGPASMVGDITGKSWNSTAPRPQQQKVAVASSIGIVNKNPNLFGDLVNSALGQNKGSGSNVPLKNATPSKNSFSMGGVANSLPKTNVGGGGVGVGVGVGGGYQSSGIGVTSNAGSKMGSGLPVGGGGGAGSNKDPFGSFVDFSSSKPMNNNAGSNDFDFGGFQTAPKSNPLKFPSANSNPLGSAPKMNNFETQKPSAPVQSSGADSFDVLFPTTTAANVAPSTGGGDQFSGGDEWGFEGGHDDRTTTELDGLPPPPAGVSALTAKTKGLDNYKQGQYADAIKWLSWAEVLLEKDGQSGASMEVLTCRASCYKEVGEYKKAVADCTKVLNHDEKNVAVLVQRALLYESMEKYRLGANDLRTVMKLDPGNRVARSTIHRLNKMAD